MGSIDKHLLPPNATKLERCLAESTDTISEIPVDIWKLWDTKHCPDAFLPWLAWSTSVEHWNPDWHDNVKRELINQSLTNHKKRGTVAAVKNAIRRVLAMADNIERDDISNISVYDNSYVIKEWWQQHSDISQPKISQQPLSFQIQLLIGSVLGGRGILGPELYGELRRAVDAVKPMSTRYTLSIGGAKFDSTLPLKGTIRVVKHARFNMKAKIGFKFTSKLNTATVTRALRYAPLTMDAYHELSIKGRLPSMSSIRSPVLLRFKSKLPDNKDN